jgi:hypothetical protein
MSEKKPREINHRKLVGGYKETRAMLMKLFYKE